MIREVMTRVELTIAAVGALAVAFAAGVAVGRSRAASGALGAGGGQALAKFGPNGIGADQIRAALASQRLTVRAGGAGSEKEIVEDLARTRILALRAEG